MCSEIANPDLTRALFDLDSQLGRVTRFEIVTPEFLWPAPGQPETPRFAAGQSDVSPDFATHPGVRLEASFDAREQLRMVDFSTRAPEALALEGLRGSLARPRVKGARRNSGERFSGPAR